MFRNNLLVGNAVAIQGEDINDLSSMTYSHNHYYNNNNIARISYTNYSFSSWQSSFNKDTVGSEVANPQFASTSDNTLTLNSSSPAINAGVDILNLLGNGTSSSITVGARVTGNEVIGVGGTGGSTIFPPPANTAAPSPAVLY